MISSSTTPNDLTRAMWWTVMIPFVGLWPFLSALPAFTLIGGNASFDSAWVNTLLLATGFWGVVPLLTLLWFMLPDARRPHAREGLRKRPTSIAVYIVVWTGLYTAIAMAGL